MAIKITLFGTIHPKKAGVNLMPIQGVKDDTGWPFLILGTNSEVTAEVEVPEVDERTFTLIVNLVREIVGATIDLLTFTRGVRFRFIVDEMIGPEGRRPVRAEMPELVTCNTSVRPETNLALRTFLGRDPQLRRALADLTGSLEDANDASINCARMVDAIKHLITPENSTEKTKWRNMHSTLNLSPSYLSLITDHSVQPRHGKAHTTPEAVLPDLFKRSWTIMDRYFHYLLAGRQKLPLDRFPLLD